MSHVINFYLSPLIKVKAKLYRMCPDGSVVTEKRKFSINTKTSNFDSLRLLLAQVFDISGEFTITYKSETKTYARLESDRDMQNAMSSAFYFPYLCLQLKSEPLESCFDDWDIVSPAELPPMECTRCSQNRESLIGSILNQFGKTLSRAFSHDSSEDNYDKSPMTQEEFQSFLDEEGRLVKPHEFHLMVYRGGIEPDLRPEAWLHLLNVFPERMTSAERDVYLQSKSRQYFRLRYNWQKLMNEGEASDTLKSITNLVRKDVRRTDRNLKFYSGSDDNKNVQILFNVLTTYAVTHPNVHYCQGMSDLLSPLLYVLNDEAISYIALCGMLNRLERNFQTDGRSIRTKFKHLRKMLCYYDRELFYYLKSEGVSNLLFCYRWLVLELKREFEYNEALHILEVMWGALPPMPPRLEIQMGMEKSIDLQNSYSSTNIRVTNDNLVWSNDHYSVSSSLQTNVTQKSTKLIEESQQIKEENASVPQEINLPIHYRKRRYRSYTNRKLNRLSLSTKENIAPAAKAKICNPNNICQSWAYGDEFENNSYRVNTAVVTAREFLRTQWCYSNTVNEIQLNNWLNGKWWESTGTPEKFNDFQSVVATLRQRHGSSDSNYSTNTANSECHLYDSGSCRETAKVTRCRRRSEGYESEPAFSSKEYSVEEGYNSDAEEEEKTEENQNGGDEDDDYDDDDNDAFSSCRLLDSMIGKKYEEALTYFHRKKELLPPPHVLGDGNPFLLFLCLTMLLQQRDKIIKKKMDVNELCVYFDKMVRKHKLSKVLNTARYLFGEYLNMGWNDEHSDSEDELIS